MPNHKNDLTIRVSPMYATYMQQMADSLRKAADAALASSAVLQSWGVSAFSMNEKLRAEHYRALAKYASRQAALARARLKKAGIPLTPPTTGDDNAETRSTTQP